MELNNEVMIATVSTDCMCEDYDEETGENVPVEYCYGDCYEWQKEDVFMVIGEWQKLNDISEDDVIRINGTKIGWQGRSGYKDTDILELDGALALDGDFTITWTLDIPTKTLKARRASHDEPMGAYFEMEILRMKPCDYCGDKVEADIHEEELGMCVECSNKYYDHSDEE